MMKSVSSSWQSLWAIRVPLPVVLVLMFLAHEASFLRSSSLIKLVAAPVMQPSPVIAPVSMMQSQIAPVTIAPQAVKPKAKLQIDPARIVVAKVLLGSLSDMYEIGLQVLRDYAKKYGYSFHVMRQASPKMSGRAPAWGKLIMYEELCATNKYDWVFIQDGDAIILNNTVRLESIMEEGGIDKDFIIAADTLILNSGNMFCRCSEWMKQFFQLAWKVWPLEPKTMEENGAIAATLVGCNENSTFNERCQCYIKADIGWRDKAAKARFYRADPTLFESLVSKDILAHVGWVNKTMMNSYYDDYVPGHFIVHAAAKGAQKNEFLRQHYTHAKNMNWV